jgi:hypothetical protein
MHLNFNSLWGSDSRSRCLEESTRNPPDCDWLDFSAVLDVNKNCLKKSCRECNKSQQIHSPSLKLRFCPSLWWRDTIFCTPKSSAAIFRRNSTLYVNWNYKDQWILHFHSSIVSDVIFTKNKGKVNVSLYSSFMLWGRTEEWRYSFTYT